MYWQCNNKYPVPPYHFPNPRAKNLKCSPGRRTAENRWSNWCVTLRCLLKQYILIRQRSSPPKPRMQRYLSASRLGEREHQYMHYASHLLALYKFCYYFWNVTACLDRILKNGEVVASGYPWLWSHVAILSGKPLGYQSRRCVDGAEYQYRMENWTLSYGRIFWTVTRRTLQCAIFWVGITSYRHWGLSAPRFRG
jgi:hypothetical protein